MHREDAILDPLTARELEILHLLAEGMSDKEIARRLFLTPGTIKWYNRQIYGKLKVSSRTDAVTQAERRHLLEAEMDGTPLSLFPPRLELPVPTTGFIGRQREIVLLLQLLQTTRLLTLIGVGGIGKTRLALRVASEMAGEFADGVYYVDLAPLSSVTLVTKAVASALDVMENPAEPLLDTLKRAIRGQQMLLVMDNFEHVIPAAPLVSDLLATDPHLKVLVTSREALRLSGEQEFPVPPLSLPPVVATSIQDVMASDAGRLFVERTQMMLPHFEVSDDNAPAIAQICARLDGLPLAIELATARGKLLSPQALLTRLDSRLTALASGVRDAPARQQTLRRTLDWSYNLLDADEQTLFARLAVFQGGRSLEAVEAVCAYDLPMDVFDVLASLVDKSLLQQEAASDGEPRFFMLETIHEYARERLAESGDAETMCHRHAAYFVDLAERAEPELHLRQQNRWFDRLELEQENLRAVLEWSLGGRDVALGVRLAGALYYFWWATGRHVEGIRWTEQLLPRLEKTSRNYHAKFLLGTGYMEVLRSPTEANSLLAKSAQIAHDLGDTEYEGLGLVIRGSAVVDNTEQALQLVEEGLACFRMLDHKSRIAFGLNVLGEVQRAGGDSANARRSWDEGLAIARQTGDLRRINALIFCLALLDQQEGDLETAIARVQEGLRMARARKSRVDLASELYIVAATMMATDQLDPATRLLAASEFALERMGALRNRAERAIVDPIIADLRLQLGESTFDTLWAEGRAISLEQAVAMALGE